MNILGKILEIYDNLENLQVNYVVYMYWKN